MNPTVVAAAIGVSGTVIVGLGGFWATVRQTGKTLDAAREARTWDRRAEAYVDALAAAHYRQARREYETRTYRIDEAADRQAQAYLGAFNKPDLYAMESRLLAFASEPVMTAMQASSNAHTAAIVAYLAWKEAAESARAANDARAAGAAAPDPGAPGEGAGNVALHTAAAEARKGADAADDEVVELIRKELQGHTRPLGQWYYPWGDGP